MHNDTPMIEHFKELSIGYLTGDLSEQDALEFARLYRSSPEYVTVFDDVERTYTAGLVVRYEGEKTTNYSIVKARIEKASRRRRTIAWISSAAAIALLFALTGLWYINDSEVEQPEMLCCNISEDSQVILPDGSGVWVKSGSTLTYDPETFESERTVTLKGEACFDVRHDMYHPFVVRTETMNVKVLGTIFNVNTETEGNGVETTLARGSIVLQDFSGNDVLFVHPGQQVVYEDKENIRINELRAWEYLLERYGTVTIPDAPLSEITDVLERVYGVGITVSIPDGVCPIVTFGFNKGDGCDEVLERLQMISGCGVCIAR